MVPQVFAQPRIRHITSFQIQNLTPFPLRDSVTSAITKPAQQSQFTPYGLHSDDLDLTISKKRLRRVSSNSLSTRHSIKSEGGDQNTVKLAFRDRERKSSIPEGEFVEGPSVRRCSTSSSNPRIPRSRAVSMSIAELHSANASTIMLPDTSQEALENLFKARLVESCLVLTISRPQHRKLVTQQEKTSSPTVTPSRKGKDQSSGSKGVVRHSSRPSTSPSEQSSRREMTRVSSVKPNGSTKVGVHVKSFSSASVRRDEASVVGLSSKADGVSTSEVLLYISPVHRPSTNPAFPFDVHTLNDDLSYFGGHAFKLQLWGRLRGGTNIVNTRTKGKDKQKDGDGQAEWNVINSWDIDLERLLPLPDDAAHLPPNTPLITLGPLGQVHYLPPQQDTETRSQSPNIGFSSEPETESPTQKLGKGNTRIERIYERRKRRHRNSANSVIQPIATTATWQDLSKLVALHSQFDSVVPSVLSAQSAIEKDLTDDTLSSLAREMQERSTILQDLRGDCSAVVGVSTSLKERIRQRSKNIEERRRMLACVLAHHADFKVQQATCGLDIAAERARLKDLRGRITPTRTALLSTLATIFPIELFSPPDLLYTILDVPLPIPLSPNDPAPPLSMPTQKNVTEETVATALGYVAQVIQLMAAYSGKLLTYPVVYIGSKSLIRDNISAIVGPRLFPLFSKGVDTYRFEYGVFLLNKNIDMLMMDRDLRALDMRHTLPNLKNLILTLTHGEAARLPLRRSIDSLSISLKNLDSSTEVPEGGTEAVTPKGEHHPQLTSESGTPPASGATTPTAPSTTPDAKSGRPLLGLSSLTDFIRLRYPSSHRGRSTGSDAADGANSSMGDGGDTGQDCMVAQHEAQQREARSGGGEVMDDKLSLSVPSATVLVPNAQVD